MTPTLPSYQIVDGTHYHAETHVEVVRVLEAVRHSQRRIRLVLGDPKTGKDWNEQFDVTGYIGRSMGPTKVPLLIHNRRSLGGHAILDHCIIGVRETGKYGRVLYRLNDAAQS